MGYPVVGYDGNRCSNGVVGEEGVPEPRVGTYEVCHRSLLVQVWRNANPLSLDGVILGDGAWVAHPANESGVDVTLLNPDFSHYAGSIMSVIFSGIEYYTYGRCHVA
jgi:hypothetical protein